MGEIVGRIQMYPESGKDWSIELNWDQSDYVRYDNLIICCENTATPTRSPSYYPSSAPTSDKPTTSPSKEPTRSDPTAAPTTDSPTRTPSRPPSPGPTTDSPSGTPSVMPTDSPEVSQPTTWPSVSPSKSPTTDEPTVAPTQNPTTDTPSGTPSVMPTQSPSTDQPTTMPSGSPSAAPTDDCVDLLVGICHCDTVTGSEITCPDPAPYMESDFNGLYSRTDEIKTGKPTYKNGYNWEIYWDDEVWVMLKPDTFFLYGEISGGIQLYPESKKDWQYISGGDVLVKEELTICCNPYAAPSRMPSTSPSENPTVSPSLSPSVSPSDHPTQFPSDNPTPEPSISEPTRDPSVSPSNVPTVEEPTVSPTVTPTKSSERSFPTVGPSSSPSDSPTTDQPTMSPQTRSPSTSPTVSPSLSPTDDCVNFLVGEGCPCTNQDIVDYFILVDGSNSVSGEDFDALKEGMAKWIENGGFPSHEESSSIAILNVFEFSNAGLSVALAHASSDDPATAANTLRSGLIQSGGSTLTEAALENVFNGYFAENYSDRNRQGFVTIVHGDAPSAGQDPCSLVPSFDEEGVVIKAVGLGASLSTIDEFSCFSPDNYRKEFYYNEYFPAGAAAFGD